MWGLIRDWLLLNTVLHGPEDTRRKVRAAGAGARRAAGTAPGLLAGFVRLVLWLVWLGLVLLGLAVAAAGSGRRDATAVLSGLLFVGVMVVVLLTVRTAWRWFRRQLASADAAAARARQAGTRGWDG